MAFGSLLTGQLLHALSARSDRQGIFVSGPPRPPNRTLNGLLLGSVAFQALALLVPGVRGSLGLTRLDPLDIAIAAGTGVLPFVANEAIKAARADAPGVGLAKMRVPIEMPSG